MTQPRVTSQLQKVRGRQVEDKNMVQEPDYPDVSLDFTL